MEEGKKTLGDFKILNILLLLQGSCIEAEIFLQMLEFYCILPGNMKTL